jgi:hypothetical protein
MPKRDKQAEDDLEEGIKQTKAAIKAFRHYLDFLDSGKGLPKAGEGRDELKTTYSELIAKLEGNVAALKEELKALG